MKTAVLVSIGSAAGGLLRYLVSLLLPRATDGSFPLATFTVNILGCFLIGVLTAAADRSAVTPGWRAFLGTGALGGFTTFSAFSNESTQLLRGGHTGTAALYIGCSTLVGLLCAYGGYALAARTA